MVIGHNLEADYTAEAVVASNMRPCLEPSAMRQGAIESLFSAFQPQGDARRLSENAVLVLAKRDCVIGTWERRAGVKGVQDLSLSRDSQPWFDLASLTKPLGTAAIAATLLQKGVIRLDDPAGKWIPEIPLSNSSRGATIEDLLSHRAGLPAGTSLSSHISELVAWRRIFEVTPACKPRQCVLYSDIGFIWLGEILARASGKPLSELLKESVLDRVGLEESVAWEESGKLDPVNFSFSSLWKGIEADSLLTMGPEGRSSYFQILSSIPSMELDLQARMRHVQSQTTSPRGVNDPLARQLRRETGHAGLFATPRGVLGLARLWMTAPRDRAMTTNELTDSSSLPLISDSALKSFLAPRAKNRGLGWEFCGGTRAAGCGQELSSSAFGHTGYTGTSVWIDPAQDLVVILLTNRGALPGRTRAIACGMQAWRGWAANIGSRMIHLPSSLNQLTTGVKNTCIQGKTSKKSRVRSRRDGKSRSQSVRSSTSGKKSLRVAYRSW